jgi:hypothetical protein
MLQENTTAPCFAKTIKYDEAGDCPVCGMDLVQAPDLTPAKTMYTCPMHPEIIQEGRALSHLRNGFSTYGTYWKWRQQAFLDLV